MANVINRLNPLDYRLSVNTPDFPIADWIHDPDVSALVNVPQKYWKIVGDAVLEMTQSEKDSVDAAEAADLLARNRAGAVNTVDAQSPTGFELRELIELFNKRDNYIISRLIELQDRVQAMLDSVGNADNMRTDGLAVNISPTATRTRATTVNAYKDSINNGDVDT